MHADQLLPSDYIRAVDLDGEATVKITRITHVEVYDRKKKKNKQKPVIYVEGDERGWVLNKTNIEYLKALFGLETDGWIGKRVTLYSPQVGLPDGSKGPAIRIKGSPDIKADITFKLTLASKSANVRLTKTGAQAAQRTVRPFCDGVHEGDPCGATNCYLADPAAGEVGAGG